MNKLFKECKKGIKANIVPGLILQAFAVSIVICYYNFDSVQSFCNSIAQMKEEHGYLFSALSTALFGGFLPFLYLIYSKRVTKKQMISHGLFYSLFWFLKGIEVDFFYRMQALLFGVETNFATISKKVLMDQFCYNLFYAGASMTLIYLWKDSEFSYKKLKESLSRETFTITIPAVIVSSWIVWVPATAIIYSLPSSLQLPLFNIVLCFFVLIVATLCTSEESLETIDA